VRNFDWLSFTPLWSPSPVLQTLKNSSFDPLIMFSWVIVICTNVSNILIYLRVVFTSHEMTSLTRLFSHLLLLIQISVLAIIPMSC
jgi:hypothetical protein